MTNSLFWWILVLNYSLFRVSTANCFFNYFCSATVDITSDNSFLRVTLVLNYRLFYGLFWVAANCLLDCPLSTVSIASDNSLLWISTITDCLLNRSLSAVDIASNYSLFRVTLSLNYGLFYGLLWITTTNCLLNYLCSIVISRVVLNDSLATISTT